MQRLIHIFLLSVMLGCCHVMAAAWQRMGLAEGLSSLETRQVVCLPSGQMLAVMGGMVNVYDGERWQPITLNRKLTVDLHSFLNTNHYIDPEGRLWIRTFHQLIAIDTRTLQQIDARAWMLEAGIMGQVQNFFIDKDGETWTHVGDDSLLVVGREKGKEGSGKRNAGARLVMRYSETNPDGLRASICDLVQVGRQHFVFFSNGHMLCLDAQTGKPFYKITLGQPSHGYYLRALPALDGRSIIVRMTDDEKRNVLVRFDTRLRQVTDTLLTAGITDFRFSDNGELWAVGGRSVWHFNKDGRHYQITDNAPVDLQASAIDKQNGLWCCTTSSGLLYHSPLHQFVSYQHLYGSTPVNCFFQRPDGRVLAGTTHGLYQTDDTNQWYSVSGSEDWNVMRIALGQQGFYLATNNKGLVSVDGTLKFRWRFGEEDNPDMRNNVNFCFDLSDGRLLFNCRLNRLMAFNAETKEMDRVTERMGDAVQTYRYIIDYLPIHDGWLMATQNGLFMLEWKKKDFHLNTSRFATLADNPWSVKFNCLFCDADGNILAGTQNGLLCYNEKQNSLRCFTTANGLPSNNIQSIAADQCGALWLATSNGLCRLTLSLGEVLALGREDGIEDNCFMERSALCLRDGRMLFGTKYGFYEFHPDSLQLPHIEVEPRLLSVRITGNEDFIAGTETLRLPYDQNFLTFTVSALNYAHATHTVYRYRLRGIDRDWVTVAGGRGKIELSYTALPHGHYTLEVQAAILGQPWGKTMTANIIILPPLWQTWWAYLIYIILALTAFYFVRRAYLSNRDMQRRIDQLLREAEERTETDTPSSAHIEEEKSFTEEKDVQKDAEMSADARRFLEKALKCIDRNMSNTDYSIEDFASDMAMERSTLYRHLQAVMGQKPLEFVRTIRLNRAAELLCTGHFSVTEVSELVGFNTPRYFIKHFQERFGCRPSEYREPKNDKKSHKDNGQS